MDPPAAMDPNFFDPRALSLMAPPSASKNNRKGDMVLATPHRVSPWKHRSCTPLSTPSTCAANLSQSSLVGGLSSGSFQSPPLTPFLLEQMNSAKNFDATPTTLLDLDMEVDVNCLDSFGIDTTSPGSRLDFSQQSLDMTPSAPLPSDGNLKDRTNMDPIYMPCLPKTPAMDIAQMKLDSTTPMLPPLSATPGTSKRKMHASDDAKAGASGEVQKSAKKQTLAKVRPAPTANRPAPGGTNGKQTSRRRSRNFGKTWTVEEDDQLRALVSERGARKWSNIAKCFERKNSKQCRERWHNILDPQINWEPFETSEDEIIIRMVKIEGFKWSKIAAHLPGRTDNHVKNRWNATLKRETQPNGMYYSATSPINLNLPPFVNPNKPKVSPKDKQMKSVKFDVEGIITDNSNTVAQHSQHLQFVSLKAEADAHVASLQAAEAAQQLIRLSPQHTATQSRTQHFALPPPPPATVAAMQQQQQAAAAIQQNMMMAGVGHLDVVAKAAAASPALKVKTEAKVVQQEQLTPQQLLAKSLALVQQPQQSVTTVAPALPR